MSVPPSPSLGALALVGLAAGALTVIVLTRIKVKVRAASRRWLGVHVCDIAADLDMTPRLRSRGYRVAFYVTMKSLPRETPETPSGAARITSNAA